ncbi:choline/ethanolamine kinase family protein [Cryptosporidium ryanae]|uniref:choline/ethanolamine kinase family protein n=1 Tax=Cryptosporidium ryanae TaxID=515981 RepID=UPI00351A2857|nr:choline/ethanolamine kinase family protein [Cryptosporidium ryanae]
MELSNGHLDIRTGRFSDKGESMIGNESNINFLTEELQRKLLEARRICWSLLKTGVCVCCNSEDLLTSKLLTGGLSNILVKVKIEKDRFCEKMLKANENLYVNGYATSEGKNNSLDNSDCSITNLRVRFYNQNRKMFINEKREVIIQNILSESGFLKPVILSFSGGQVEEYIEGRTLEVEDVRMRKVYLSIAKRIAHLHSIKVPSELSLNVIEEYKQGTVNTSENISIVWPTLNNWLLRAEKMVNTRANFKKIDFVKLNDLISKVRDYLYATCDTGLLSPNSIVISHCDLLPGNIIETCDKNHVFIDYEFSGTAERAFDLGNHFCEWAGFSCEWQHLPTDDQLREFVFEYIRNLSIVKNCNLGSILEIEPESIQFSNSLGTNTIVNENNANGGKLACSTDSRNPYELFINNYVSSIKAFMIISNIYWGLWAICKSEVNVSSTNNTCFDYKSYGYRKLSSVVSEPYFCNTLKNICPLFDFNFF